MIRIGIIGTGCMAGWHAERFKAINGCRLVACSDIVPGKALEFAAKFGVPAAYTDAAEMLEREKPDGVSVVTPDKSHAPMTLLALRHGVHVMCEKPLADTVENARKMLAAARNRKLINCVNFSKRNIFPF